MSRGQGPTAAADSAVWASHEMPVLKKEMNYPPSRMLSIEDATSLVEGE